MGKEKDSDYNLDNLVARYPKLMGFSFQDLYLTLYAMKRKSIPEAERIKDSYFHTTGGRKKILEINDRIEQDLKTDGLFIITHGRIEPTSTGEKFLAEMPKIISQFCESLENIRVHKGDSVRVGATQFMMELVVKYYPEWKKIIGEGEIDLRVIRSAEMEDVLISRHVDLAFGACLGDQNADLIIDDALEGKKIKEETIGILTNVKSLSSLKKVKKEKELSEILETWKIIIPEKGIIRQFADQLQHRYPGMMRKEPKITNDLFLAITELLHETVFEGCMFLLGGLPDKISRVWTEPSGRKGKLNFITISNDLYDTPIYIGLFRRKIDNQLGENNILQRIWSSLETKK